MGDIYGKFKLPADKFKSCPFCGGVPYEQVNFNENIDQTITFVKCTLCGASSKPIFTRGYHPEMDEDIHQADMEAYAAWQRREGQNE